MGVLALTNAFAHIGGYDFTGDTNELRLAVDVTELDKTNFRSGGWKEVIGGVKSSAFDLAGFWQSAATQAVDPEAFPDLGVANRVLTFGPAETEASVAYMAQLGKFRYELGGPHGEIAPFKLGCTGTDGVGVVRGQLAKAKGNVSTAVAIGTGLNLGNVGATQFLYGTFHVFTAGTTITVVLESDDSGAFASATTRATFGPITVAGGTWATRVAGPLTETHYRLRVTAITGTFNVAGAIGIQ